MPIYEFECLSCGKRFDRLQKMSDPDPTDCPTCGKPQVKRAVTAAAFRLKGGGWYETDFKGDGDKKRNLVESGGESKPAAEVAASGGEAKPAPAAETGKPAAPAPAGD
jgi:putative FmdB family regulatory protein